MNTIIKITVALSLLTSYAACMDKKQQGMPEQQRFYCEQSCRPYGVALITIHSVPSHISGEFERVFRLGKPINRTEDSAGIIYTQTVCQKEVPYLELSNYTQRLSAYIKNQSTQERKDVDLEREGLIDLFIFLQKTYQSKANLKANL